MIASFSLAGSYIAVADASEDDGFTHHMLGIGYINNQFDYFGDGNSPYSIGGSVLTYSYISKDNWSITLASTGSDNRERWLTPGPFNSQLESRAEGEESNYSVGASWLLDRHSIAVSYARSSIEEQSLSRLPATLEQIDSQNQVMNIIYGYSGEHNKWQWDIQLGSQYTDAELDVVQTVFTDPPTRIIIEQKPQLWSAITDISVGYWIEDESLIWSPELTLGWTWELSRDEQLDGAVFRDGRIIPFNQGVNQFFSNTRIPDSGFWQLSALIIWNESWNSQISYGNTINNDLEINNWTFDINVSF
ncbi:MAG: hypothetical protein V2I33_00865 [Kangiellaceae bacterium]|nr:hypothetical protein [Kangiellaceae bacterium]